MDLVNAQADDLTHLTRDTFGWVDEELRRTLCGQRPGATLLYKPYRTQPSCPECLVRDERPTPVQQWRDRANEADRQCLVTPQGAVHNHLPGTPCR